MSRREEQPTGGKTAFREAYRDCGLTEGMRTCIPFAAGPFATLSSTPPPGKSEPAEPPSLAPVHGGAHAVQELWEDGTWRQIRDTWFDPARPFATDIRFAITPYPKRRSAIGRQTPDPRRRTP